MPILAHKVFISAASRDLRSFRDSVRNALGAKHIVPIWQEAFPTEWRRAAVFLRAELETCDALLHIVGFACGDRVDARFPGLDDIYGDRPSYTQFEYLVARELQEKGHPIKVFTFVVCQKDQLDGPRPTDKIESPEALALQEMHRQRLLAVPTEVSGSSQAANEAGSAEALARKEADRQRLLAGQPMRYRFNTREQLVSLVDKINFEQPGDASPDWPSRKRVNEVVQSLAFHRFKGRHEPLRTLQHYLLDENVRIITVWGQGGMGKTALVSKFILELERKEFFLVEETEAAGAAGRSRRQAVSAVLFVNLKAETRRSPDQIVELIYSLVDEKAGRELQRNWAQPISLEAKLDFLFGTTLGKPDQLFLIVLDNFEDLLDNDTNDVRPEYVSVREFVEAALKHGSRAARLIVTSRRSLRLPPAIMGTLGSTQRIEIPLHTGLSEEEAVQLLRELDGDNRCGLREAPRAELAEVARLTGGVPHTLESIYGKLSNEYPLTLSELREDQAEFRALLEDPARSLYGSLRADLRQVMQGLSIFDAPVPPAAVQALLPALPVPRLLGQLRALCAVEYDGEMKVYALHRLNGNYAYSQIEAAARSDSHRRAAEYFRGSALPLSSMENLVGLQPRLQEFDQHCKAFDYDAAAGVLNEFSPLLQRWGKATLAEELHLRLLDQPLSPTARLLNLLGLGRARLALGNAPAAVAGLKEALALSCQLGDQAREADVLNELGNTEVSGDYGRAQEFFQGALDLHRRLGDPTGEGGDLRGLSTFYWVKSDFPQACGHARKAIEMHQAAGDAAGEGSAWCCLGYALTGTGDYPHSTEAFQEAITLQKKAGNRRGLSEALCGIGSPFWYTG